MIRTGALFFAAIAFFAGGTLASAQVVPGRPGITVIGRGTVRRPADVVRFTINVSNNCAAARNENDTANAGPCPTKPDRVFTGFNNGFDPSASALDVVLVVNASVTYEIH